MEWEHFEREQVLIEQEHQKEAEWIAYERKALHGQQLHYEQGKRNALKHPHNTYQRRDYLYWNERSSFWF